MVENSVKVKRRQSCPFCFKPLNRDDTNPDLCSFVQCEACEGVYHKICWDVANQCTNRPDNNFLCEKQKAKAIIIRNPIARIRAINRTPIRFTGLVTHKPISPPVAAKSTTQTSTKADTKSPTAAPVVAEPTPQRSSKRPFSFGAMFARLVAAALATLVAWGGVALSFAGFEVERAAEFYRRNSSNELVLGFAIASMVFLFIFYGVLSTVRESSFWKRYLIPLIIGTVGFLVLNSQVYLLSPFGSQFDGQSLQFIPQQILYPLLLTFSIVLLNAHVQRVAVRMLLTTFGIGAILVGLRHLDLYEGFYFPLREVTILAFALGIGFVPWLPELFVSDGADTNTSQSSTLTKHVLRRGILYRTIGLALPLFLAFRNLAQELGNCYTCNVVPTDTIRLMFALLPSLGIAFFFNSWIIEPTLRNKGNEGFWKRGFRAVFMGAIIGGVVSYAYLAAASPYIPASTNDSAPLAALSMAGVSVFFAIVMTISAATGRNRTAKVFKAMVWIGLFCIVFMNMANFVISSFDDSARTMYENIGPMIFAGLAMGVASAILTIPTWFADWLAKGDYEP